jgi:integrase
MTKTPLMNWVGRLFGSSPSVTPQSLPLFDDAVKHYRAALDARPIVALTVHDKLAALKNHVLPVLTGRPVNSIRPFEVARIVRSVHDEGNPVASRRVLSVLRDLFNEALLMGWVDINPALHVKRLPAPIQRRRLTLEQFQVIYEYGRDNYPPWFGPCVRLALVTAQRRSDLVRLRFSDVRDGHLFIEQYKTTAMVAIPLAVRLDALGCTVGDVINECRRYRPNDNDLMLRNGRRAHRRVSVMSLSNRFCEARKAVCPHDGPGNPPSFHEIRSLSERLYRAQGVDTQKLLGHKHQSMTDVYNNERGLNAGKWIVVPLPKMVS